MLKHLKHLWNILEPCEPSTLAGRSWFHKLNKISFIIFGFLQNFILNSQVCLEAKLGIVLELKRPAVTGSGPVAQYGPRGMRACTAGRPSHGPRRGVRMRASGFTKESPIYPFITRHYADYCNRDTFCRETPELTYLYHGMVPSSLRMTAQL